MSNKKWLKMRFKKSRVWALCNEQGEPVITNGNATIKYDLLQTQAYSPLFINLTKIRGETELRDDPGKDTRIKNNKAFIPSNIKTKEPGNTDDLIVVYTDGASSNNPGPAGLGVVLMYKGKRKEISHYIGEATNNIAELMAVKIALEQIKPHDIPVVIYTDSAYVQGILARAWKARQNIDLIEEIRDIIKKFKLIYLLKVKGHSGVKENEEADRLACMAIETRENSEKSE